MSVTRSMSFHLTGTSIHYSNRTLILVLEWVNAHYSILKINLGDFSEGILLQLLSLVSPPGYHFLSLTSTASWSTTAAVHCQYLHCFAWVMLLTHWISFSKWRDCCSTPEIGCTIRSVRLRQENYLVRVGKTLWFGLNNYLQ